MKTILGFFALSAIVVPTLAQTGSFWAGGYSGEQECGAGSTPQDCNEAGTFAVASLDDFCANVGTGSLFPVDNGESYPDDWCNIPVAFGALCNNETLEIVPLDGSTCGNGYSLDNPIPDDATDVEYGRLWSVSGDTSVGLCYYAGIVLSLPNPALIFLMTSRQKPPVTQVQKRRTVPN